MPNPPTHISGTISGLSLGAGTRFVSLSSLYAEFAPWGFTYRQFRLFLRALGVPVLVTPTRLHLVHYFKFILALETISLLGSPDFWSPGLQRQRRHKLPPGVTLSLPTPTLESQWQRALSELLVARRLPGLSNPPLVRQSFEAAVSHLSASLARATATHHLAVTQRAYTLASKDKFLDPTTDDPETPNG